MAGVGMGKRVPYIFCRYQIDSDGEVLDAPGQRAFFTENQGQAQTHATRADRQDANALIMEPLDVEAEEHTAISFHVGYQPGYRRKVGYNSETQQRTTDIVQDDHIKSAHVVVIPELGCMAIEDRVGEDRVGHETAIRALRSITKAVLDASELNVIHLNDGEVRAIVGAWELIQYDYVMRPLNPVRLSDFNEMRSEAMKQDRVALDAGKLRPVEGETMVANGGTISQVQEVVDAGYAQNGLRAVTPFGNEARVPKPRFHMDKAKNFAEREKPRFLKIMFDADEGREPDSAGIAATLVRFYALNEPPA